MTKNVRLLLGALALVALVLASYLLNLSGTGAVASRQQQAEVLRTLLKDDDGDGLVNGDEQYWQTDPQNPDTDGDGFLDGEEVLGGHDPRIPGPKDYLDHRQNLTQQTTDLLVGGLLSGDLKPDNPNYQATLDTLIRTFNDQNAAAADSSLVKVKLSDNSDEAKLAYITAMLKTYPDFLGDSVASIRTLLESIGTVHLANPSELTDDTERYAAFRQEALRISDEVGARAAAGLAIPVPPMFKRQHTNIILVLQLLQTDLRLAATMHEDPVLGMAAVQRVIRLTTEAIPVVIHDFALAMNKKL